MNNYQQRVQSLFSKDELTSRQIVAGKNVTVMYLTTMCLDDKVSSYVFKPLLEMKEVGTLDDIVKKLAFGADVKKEQNFQDAVSDVSGGYALVFVSGEENCVAVDCRTPLGRSVSEPPTSMVMHGPREGFVENLKSNLTLIRKRLKTDDLKTKYLNVGKYTNTQVVVCYINGVANRQIVDDIAQTIRSINVDGIIDSSYVARYLDKRQTLLFNRVGSTEKPDVVVGKLLEGRVAVVVDGSPMVLTLPYLFIEDLQSPGDYYENNILSSVSRVLRFASVIASVLLPGVYVCLQMYNYQIIPLHFLVTILSATENIPFSPIAEMLLIIVIFDILREANLRMPSVVGISLSLVGAIVLGDAAVKAGLFGAPAVMIGALSGIGLFAMPNNTLVLSFMRVVITLVGGVTGLYGIILSCLVVLLYLIGLNSYQTPFLAPLSPFVARDNQDALLQKPVNKQEFRPKSFPTGKEVRRK